MYLKSGRLKTINWHDCVRGKTDTHGTTAGRSGPEHAQAARCAWPEPGGARPRKRVNRTYLSSVERAERNVSIDNVARIAKALAVEPWKLLKDG
jgi:hypothetical protein